MFFGTSPGPKFPWLWGDPFLDTRAVTLESMIFLHQPAYTAQVGITPMSDFRFVYRADFDALHLRVNEIEQFEYVLRAVKPSRIEDK